MIKQYNFKDIVRGNSFNQIKITFPFDITNSCISVQFRNKIGGKVAFEWGTNDNTIDVLSTTEIYLLSRLMDYPAYKYYYDFTIVFSDGTTFTYFAGTLEITQNISEGCLI